jgi:hypothetical protein
LKKKYKRTIIMATRTKKKNEISWHFAIDKGADPLQAIVYESDYLEMPFRDEIDESVMNHMNECEDQVDMDLYEVTFKKVAVAVRQPKPKIIFKAVA